MKKKISLSVSGDMGRPNSMVTKYKKGLVTLSKVFTMTPIMKEQNKKILSQRSYVLDSHCSQILSFPVRFHSCLIQYFI